MRTTVGDLVCNACGHQYQRIHDRSEREFERVLYELTARGIPSKDVRMVGEPCLQEFQFTRVCDGELRWIRLPWTCSCASCGRLYPGQRSGKCGQFTGRDRGTGKVSHCGGALVERPQAGVLQCQACQHHWTLVQEEGRAKLACAHEYEQFKELAKPPSITEIVSRSSTTAPGAWMRTVDHSDEIAFDSDGTAIIPAKYQRWVELGPTVDSRMRVRLNGWPEEFLNGNIQVRSGSTGWQRGHNRLLAKAGEPCGRTIKVTSRCKGICEFRERAVEVTDVVEFDPRRWDGIHVREHEIQYEEI